MRNNKQFLMHNKENRRPGALLDDDVVSVSASEAERQLEEELARLAGDPGEGELQERSQMSLEQDDDDSEDEDYK